MLFCFLLMCCFTAIDGSNRKEAYAVSASSVDTTAAPGYIYAALSLISSIRRFDHQRDILVLVDAWTMLVYPTVRHMFEANGAIVIVNQAFKQTSKMLRSDIQRNWIGSFAKLNLLQLPMLGYETILYADSDGTFLRDPSPLFSLPFSSSVTAYGMRDLYGCNVVDNRTALMGACFMWSARGHAIEMYSSLVDLMFLTKDRIGYVPDDQRLLSMLFGDRLRLFDESMVTNVLRCRCKREHRGVVSLNETIYAHFMSVVIDVARVSALVVINQPFHWVQSTLETSYVDDCEGPAFESWVDNLRNALSKLDADKRDVLIARRYPTHCPEEYVECKAFVYTSIVDAENIGFVYDNNADTVVRFPDGARKNAFITVVLGFLQRQTTFETVDVTFASGRKPVLGVDFVWLINDDDRRATHTGFVGRRAVSVTIKFVRDFPDAFGIEELRLSAIMRMTAKFMIAVPGTHASMQPGSQFVLRSWRPTDRSLAFDDEHSEVALFDDDLKSALYIPSPANGTGLLVEFGRAYLLCGIKLFAGDNDGDVNGDSFVDDVLYGNDGSMQLGEHVSHRTTPVVRFDEPTNLYNLFIKFVGHRQWLRIREVQLIHANSSAEEKCPVSTER